MSEATELREKFWKRIFLRIFEAWVEKIGHVVILSKVPTVVFTTVSSCNNISDIIMLLHQAYISSALPVKQKLWVAKRVCARLINNDERWDFTEKGSHNVI